MIAVEFLQAVVPKISYYFKTTQFKKTLEIIQCKSAYHFIKSITLMLILKNYVFNDLITTNAFPDMKINAINDFYFFRNKMIKHFDAIKEIQN